jgi:hypothetical protein
MFVTRPVDSLEQDFVRLTAAMSRLDALRLDVLRQLDVAQVATADGARSLIEWVSGRFDLESDTAKTLVALARTADREVEELLEAGHISFDRAAAVVRLKAAGADQATVDRSWSHDLTGVRRLSGGHRRISPVDEVEAFDARYLHLQPSLDESHTRLWGQFTGADGRILEKALQAAVDSFPNNPDTTPAQDRADALVGVASEWLSGEVGGHELAAEIFVDAQLATITDGETGATVISGPRVGPNTLHEILCSGTVRINFADSFGNISTSPTSRAIPSAVRRRVLYRDGHRCVIAGCRSRSRLQPHHLTPYAQGGTHHPDNLVTLCWYHHHIVIHQQGRRIDPDSPAQRRTFIRERHPTRAGP